MDHSRFDSLTKELIAMASSRRGIVPGAVIGFGSVVLGAMGLPGVGAKKKKKKKCPKSRKCLGGCCPNGTICLGQNGCCKPKDRCGNGCCQGLQCCHGDTCILPVDTCCSAEHGSFCDTFAPVCCKHPGHPGYCCFDDLPVCCDPNQLPGYCAQEAFPVCCAANSVQIENYSCAEGFACCDEGNGCCAVADFAGLTAPGAIGAAPVRGRRG